MNGFVTRRLAVTAALIACAAFPSSAAAAFTFDSAWGTPGSGNGQFSNPALMATDGVGNLYVVDTGNDRIQKFTADGAFLLAWGGSGTGPSQFNAPNGVAVGPSGAVYVTDTGNNRVSQFDSNGAPVFQWGSFGSGNGLFNGPVGIAAGPEGSVYVGDSGNARVQRFQADGAFVSSFGSGAGGFGQIAGVASGPDGSVYVADGGNSRLERFDLNGAFLGTWGSVGAGDGQFQAPIGVSANSRGVYVADPSLNRVQKFSAAGAFDEAFDATNSGDPQFAGPFGIATPPSGSVYVSQGSSARVARYIEATPASELPPPTTGETANVEPTGRVLVKRPGGGFELLDSATQIPIGSIVDVRKGTIKLTTTSGPTGTQTATFFQGVFRLLQDKARRPVTELRLYGGNFRRACGRAGGAHAAARKKSVRHLWGNGSGRFRTRGRYSSATVRGTEWLTDDRCDGTLTRVKQGSVTIRDLVRRRNVVVRAGRQYLARAR